MKRSQLVSTLAMSVGVAGWFAPLSSQTLRAGECDSPRTCQCRCSSNSGLLDTLDQYATKMTKQGKQRSSILAAFKIDMSVGSSRCDQTDCDCEPTCGSETNDCAQPECGVEFRPSYQAPTYNHVLGPVEYPQSTTRSPQPVPSHVIPMTPVPQTNMPRGNSLPRVIDAERIPVPKVEDSTIDPFRDDTTSHQRPARLRVQPASQRTLNKAQPRAQKTPIMSFDPHSQAVPAPPRTKRDLERKSLSIADQLSSSRRSTVVHRLLSDESEAVAAEMAAPNESHTETSVVQAEPTSLTGKVVQATALQPARLPALSIERPVQESTAQEQPLEVTAKSKVSAEYNPLRD
jgi:hypothetical protein